MAVLALVAAMALTAAGPGRAHAACETVDLLAGQTTLAGSVCVESDNDSLTVTYETSGGWELQKTHLAIAHDLSGIPRTANGTPVPGQFPYSTVHDPPATTATHVVALGDIGAEPGDTVIVAAHATVQRVVGGSVQTAGAWGDGTRFTPRGAWATYFTHTITPEDVTVEPPDHEFDAIGNTLLEVGVAASGHPAVRVTDRSLLDGVDPGFAVTAVDETTANGGTVTWAADGTFSYLPPAAFTGDDTFTYTVALGAASGTGAVTVTVEHMVWYVDMASSGDGRSPSPLATLAGAQAASGPGDIIFVYAGAGPYTQGIALQAGQTLLGEAAGLEVGGHALVAPGARPSIAAAAGNAIALASNTTVEGLDVTGAPGDGLLLFSGSGTVTVSDLAVSGTTGDAVRVFGGTAAVTLDGVPITNTSGHSVRVTNLTGGSVALSGAVIDTGLGVDLAGNTGSTVAFTGVLDITTSGSTAFAATGGGAVTSTAAGSKLLATGARALHVSGTTIGAAGLRFASISASGSTHGIDVSGAGTGPLVVDGDGSANRNGSGGTISGMSSHGVTLSSAGPVTLRNMNVLDNAHVGVRAQNLTGLSLHALRLEGNTTDQANPATRNSVWLRNVTGQVRLNDSFVTGSVHNQVDIENSSGTVAVEVARTTLDDNGINSGLQVEAVGTSTVTLDVADSTFTDHHATGVHAFARNTADLTVTVDGSTFTGNNVAVNLAAQHSATMSSAVTGNTISGHASHSINATVHEDATHDAVVTGNSVNTAATAASVGIRLVTEDTSLLRGRVETNTVSGQTSGHGFRLLARDNAGNAHLVLRDNSVTTTSSSPAYSLEILQNSYLCGVISGNTGSSSHPTRDVLVDLFDAGARGDFEGAPVGQLTQAQLEAHLSAQNPGPRIGAFVSNNAFGVAANTCERPS